MLEIKQKEVIKMATKKSKKDKKVVDLNVKCEDCGKQFKRSKFASNQVVCPKCAKGRKLARIKAKNKMKRRIASLRNFGNWADNHKVTKKAVETVRAKLLPQGTSQRFQYFKANYPQYVAELSK